MTSSGKSGTRNLEVESLRSRTDSTGGCVKLKTVREIRRGRARDTFIAESVYLVLNSVFFLVASGEIETEERWSLWRD